MFRLLTIAAVLWIGLSPLKAQFGVNDTTKIEEVIIESFPTIVSPETAFKSLEIDSVALSDKSSGNLADVLNEHSTIFVKSYGSGGLSSVSFRGTSASHTMLLWNDIPINSSLNGQVDFSLIPLAFFDGVGIDFGGASLDKNAGSLGGSINLTNSVDYKNQLSIEAQQRFASFGNSATSLIIKGGNTKVQAHMRAFYKSGENDYTFINKGKEGFPEEQLKNSAVQQYGVMGEIFYLLNSRNELRINASYLAADREIPAIMLINNNKEQQQDYFNRLGISYTLRKDLWQFNFKSNMFDNQLNYENLLLQTNSSTAFKGIKNIATASFQPSTKHSFKTKLHYDYDVAENKVYQENKRLERRAFFLNYSYSPTKRIILSALTRLESVSRQPALVLPAFGASYQLFKKSNWLFRLNLSKNAKYPNLNDLYWNPGGNKDLKVEKSEAIEIGLANKSLPISEQLKLEVNANVFYLKIEDYILWEPSAFGYWKSRNIEEVQSKGVELNLGLTAKVGNVKNRTIAQYGYTSSINKKVKQVNDASVNKQLIYVPEHAFNLRSTFEWKEWGVTYQLNYNAERFTTTDNSEFLPFYTLHNIQLQKQLFVSKQRLVIMFEVNNLLDNSYEAIQWRPMPGRNYGITINYQFIK